MNEIEEAHSDLESLVQELDLLAQTPEAYIDEYFAELRNQVDLTAETWLLRVEPGSEFAVLINSKREAIIDELERHCKQCYESLQANAALQLESNAENGQTSSGVKYLRLLEEIREKYARLEEDEVSSRSILDEYSNLRMRIEHEKWSLCGRFLRNEEIVFLPDQRVHERHREKLFRDPSRLLGRLLIVTGTKLTDSEIQWIKDFYSSKASAYSKSDREIVKGVNDLEKPKQKGLFRSQVPRNIFVLAELVSKEPEDWVGLDYSSVQFKRAELDLERAGIETMGKDVVLNCYCLVNLDLRSNKIEKLDADSFAGLRNLVRLNLSSNKIGSLNKGLFSGMNKLGWLNLSHNQIQSMSVQTLIECQALTHLDLSHNKLKQIELASFTKLVCLKYLNLNANRINRITSDTTEFNAVEDETAQLIVILPPKNRLRTLRLNNNQIPRIDRDDFRCFCSLTWLDLLQNQITSVDEEAFSALEELESLNLSQNLIEDLGKNTFAKNLKLNTLCLKGNKLREVNSKRKMALEFFEVDEGVRVRRIKTPRSSCRFGSPCSDKKTRNYLFFILIALFILAWLGLTVFAILKSS